MNPPTIALLLVIAFAIGGIGGELDGTRRANRNCEVRVLKIEKDLAEQRVAAVENARTEERRQQEQVNEALREQHEKVLGINARLERDLERLRKRPERPASLPPTPRPACEGANGAELGASHAVFLRRFASLAAEYDAALAACYKACGY